jgi:hypothetical protein
MVLILSRDSVNNTGLLMITDYEVWETQIPGLQRSRLENCGRLKYVRHLVRPSNRC